jgi:hypothetical protein
LNPVPWLGWAKGPYYKAEFGFEKLKSSQVEISKAPKRGQANGQV